MFGKAESYTISVVLLQEGEWWSAQCLEYDIAAQAKTLPDLYYELEKTFVSHISVSDSLGQEPFADLEPAPTRYWEMFQNAKLRVEGSRVPFRVPSTSRYPIPIPELRVAEPQIA